MKSVDIQDDIDYIDQQDQLQSFCATLNGAGWIALDTEFLRERTYYPQLCLIQIAAPETIAVIDPLGVESLDPFLDHLYDENILKIVHAGRQDMEIFYHMRQHVPAPVFDTQIAAPLLGYADQIGYGRLVEDVLDVRLTKSHSRTDWSHRPLSAAQINYAADDVRYLAQLYPRMCNDLETRGRLGWLETDFETLSAPSTYDVSYGDVWRRVKGYDRLRSKQLSALQLMAAWREKTAQQENKPRKWLISDDVLLSLARMMPATDDELQRVRGLHPRVLKQHSSQIIALVNDAGARRPDPLPDYQRPQPLASWQEPVVDILTAVIKQIASREELNPSVLASRKDIERIVKGETELDALRGWRGELIKAPLLLVLNGEQGLRITETGLELVDGL